MKATCRPEAGLASPKPLRGPPSPAEGGGRARGISDSGEPRNDRRPGKPDPRLRAFAREQRRSYTRAEDAVWQQVRGGRFHGLKFRRQVPIPPYIADFLCASARLIVELDGEPHETEARRLRDAKRDAWLKGQGFTVLRFPNELVLSNLDAVLNTVRAAIAAQSGHGSSLPPLRGRVAPEGGRAGTKSREGGATAQDEALPVPPVVPCPEPASPLPTPADAGATLPRRGGRERSGSSCPSLQDHGSPRP
ncbi:endonuclease domain-containing protein [Methylobacterium sp. J-030]|uniref:endonuclease domain-containing protein n=1 Tax=Methylobacterium sp. J-030 TaxID=2836627 RepID=UPI001FB94B12|nr:endonuclease domain-containing protein [Methylobacterium sp. J-030]MCJ2067732.1 endonuclease domain-containing protein [Methylobacterium sp. J-030]